MFLQKNQLDTQKKVRLQVWPRLIRMIENQENLLFVDEAVYSSTQIAQKVWAPRGLESPMVARNKISFKAVAVVAAMDIRGKVVAVHMKEKSIKKADFLDFLKLLRESVTDT